MKKTKKIILLIMIFIGIILLTQNVKATTIEVSPSSPVKGKSVTITVSVPNVNTVDLTANISGAGTSGTIRIVDGSMTGEAKTFSKKLTVTPTSTGTIKISISSNSNAVLNGQYVNVSASREVTVVEPEPDPKPVQQPEQSTQSKPSNNTQTTKPSTNTSKPTKTETTTTKTETKKSTDSSLAVLTVTEGTITPEFSKDIKEYTMEVPNEVTVLNINATPNDSKAKVAIIGNLELIEGENIVTVTVVAEDGNKTDYIIKVTRALKELSLNTLIVKYENQEGELIEIPLNPIFSQDTLEYTMQNLEYWVKDLKVEALANREGATVEIEGADNLVEGENIITITVKMPVTAEEGIETSEETKIYTIKVIKDAEPAPPTVMAKISNWYNNNQDKIVFISLMVAIVLLLVLSIFIIIDYKKYQAVLSKIAQLNNLNGIEVESIAQIESKEEFSEIIEENKKNKKGKH